MLFLLFQLGPDLYAIGAGEVAEVIPLVALKKLPGQADQWAGQFVYGGEIVPALDLPKLVGQPSAQPFMSTRIIVVARGPNAIPSHIGIIAERMTDTIELAPERFAGGRLELPYFGGLAATSHGLVRRLDSRALIATCLTDGASA